MMKRYAAAAAILLGMTSAAQALEFQPLGGGTLGIGGAGVARTYGALAPYWNPAGLAYAPKTVTVSVVAGAGLQPKGKLAEDLDNFNSAYDAFNVPGQTPTQLQNSANALAGAANALLATNTNDTLRATAQAALGAQIKHMGFGVYGTFEAGATPGGAGTPFTIPVNPATVQADLSNNLSGTNPKTVTIRGIVLLDAPLSYGYAFKDGTFALGASAKYLYAETTSMSRAVYDTTTNKPLSSSDLTKDLSKDRKGSSGWGIDLGAIWKPTKSSALGVVAKNLNEPSFDANGAKITVNRQVRAGGTWEPLSWLELAADVDVFNNPTLVPGLRTQHLGGGAEFHPFNSLRLRAGGYTDLNNTDTGALTAGLSLGIPWFYLDLDGAYGLGKVRYKNNDYPTEAKVQASVNFAF